MVKMKKITLAVALGLSLSPLATQAIGLGQISSKAELNKPMNIRIPIMTEEPDLTGLKVSLANATEHARFGIEYPLWLPKFSSEVVQTPQGFYLQLTSLQPIKEPVVDFILQLDYQGAQLYKEITLLLDYSVASQEINKTGPQSMTTSVESSRVVRTIANPTMQLTAGAREKLVSNSRVIRGQSLWTLAKNWKANGLTQNEKMSLIFNSNPHAFINGDRNLLKEGALINYTTDTAFASNAPENSSLQSAQAEQSVQAIQTSSQTVQLQDFPAKISAGDSAAQSKIENLEGQIAQLNETIEQQAIANEQMKRQLAQLETILAKLDKQPVTTLPEIELAETQVTGESGVELETIPTIPESATTVPASNETITIDDSKTDAQPPVLQGETVKSDTESNSWWQSNIVALITLSGGVLLLGGVIFGRVNNQLSVRKFEEMLRNKLKEVEKNGSKKYTSMPKVKELKLPRRVSISTQFKCIQSAAKFYLRCHRHDLAKELVNESLVEHASNSKMVTALLKLRKAIYLQIDSELSKEIVDKLEHAPKRNSEEEPMLKVVDSDDLWDKKVS
ncbi:FimV family protein [Aliikangiella sp. G2MR2-5]|uniref:type IV pilus assembly protein FimV n=1 Tax=Aliikangiella sp. G2MR2-5 TaxID=2788943 RepID=UPI0018AA2E2F|nr:hypothetical protein [Aliikangiella sp. G2MR2-5]